MRLPGLCLAALLFVSGSLQAQTFAVTKARIFDGEKTIDRGTVVVRDGRIEAVGALGDIKIPDGVQVVDAGGGTVLPGLIDAHTHTFLGGLERALTFGVTTELDMGNDPAVAGRMRDEQKAPGGTPGRADLLSAGYLATAPGGHGTQYGLPIPTLTKPAEAQAWVDARIAEGSDYIKIVIEDFSAYGGSLPSLDQATVEALIQAAHARGRLAVAHVSTAATARMAIEGGVDGLVHLFTDKHADPGFAKLAAGRKAFVIPTLTVLESTNGLAAGRTLVQDLQIRGYLLPDEIANLTTAFPATTAGGMPVALDTVRQLAAAGVAILAGSDCPNPGTMHGASLHRELELLVDAGLTPAQALTAATSAPARAFRLADRGRIAPGLRADLILVAGNPLQDIKATRNLVRVWKGGVPFERKLAPAPAPAAPAAPAPAAPSLPADGLVSGFEDGKLSAAFGAGWADSTDQMRGGASAVKTSVVDGGADGSARSLEITGEVKAGFAFPWAGAVLFPGAKAMEPTDLSGIEALEFWAKGDDRPYTVMVFAKNLGPVPSMQPLAAGPEWKKYTFPLSAFPGVDPKGLTGFFFGATQQPGAFKLQIDGVRLVAKSGNAKSGT